VYPTTGTLGFDGSWFDWATMFLHMALSSTSLFFHVIRKRIKARPMIIYEEYVDHPAATILRYSILDTTTVIPNLSPAPHCSWGSWKTGRNV